MYFDPFFQYFKKLAETETRVVKIRNSVEIPDGDYSFQELYCNNPGCDCRRVHISVFRDKATDPYADINFGWDTPEYYDLFHGYKDNRAADAILNPHGEQSQYAPYLLKCFKQLILSQEYLERIKRHYSMVKLVCKEKAAKTARVGAGSSPSKDKRAIAKKKRKIKKRSRKKSR